MMLPAKEHITRPIQKDTGALLLGFPLGTWWPLYEFLGGYLPRAVACDA